mmetsp:Transcript_20594/g.69682  ORF Transcript_20594/g.69682 Transcript_20594/m.69682 type:complete len:212 (+) Transcript_20594:927-1562(+)
MCGWRRLPLAIAPHQDWLHTSGLVSRHARTPDRVRRGPDLRHGHRVWHHERVRRALAVCRHRPCQLAEHLCRSREGLFNGGQRDPHQDARRLRRGAEHDRGAADILLPESGCDQAELHQHDDYVHLRGGRGGEHPVNPAKRGVQVFPGTFSQAHSLSVHIALAFSSVHNSQTPHACYLLCRTHPLRSLCRTWDVRRSHASAFALSLFVGSC